MIKTFARTLFALSLVGCAADLDTADPGTDDVAGDEGTAADAITGPDMMVAFSRGLVRIDFSDGFMCSGFLVGPNLVMTAAHCVSKHSHEGTPEGEGTFQGVRWGHVDARIVFKPSASETMCLHASCFTAGGFTQHTTFLGWWHAGWEEGSADDDIALLTRGTGAGFVTRAMHPDDPAPRALNTSDYMRIFASSADETELMAIAGYGANSDNTIGTDPRFGSVTTDSWSTQRIRAQVNYGAAFGEATCSGDSGGALFIPRTIENRDYVAGIISGTTERDGFCPETGDQMFFSRIGPDIGLVNVVQGWAGKPDCSEFFDTGSLPGTGKYFRCW